ncbi:MAG TPA: peptide chain release factor N(5)-glutamine methyltransferase [Brevundimonas sp.]|jgi:release factor glutamine methyltransferase|uniref:peptide chain release factor N(5)-glutamine methyltransferase n=1 Tax=Brevundimonas sp. TaxID=1871086 RepID=UPI002E1540BE|nr:peptide chain release factor N(5)-glutamine methyltransferase [Brevundimonas sp.]
MSDTTLLTAWKAAQARLKAGRIDSPAIDARLLLEAATGAGRVDILTDPYRAVTPEQAAALDAMVERRLRREPVSRILGRKGFWKILLTVTPDVLSPRPDTETLLDVVLKAKGEREAFTACDLGTGSGAILLALLAERPAAKGVGTDVSSEALAVARENAANLDLNDRATFIRTDWAAGFADASFDVVLSNPPYIPSGDIPGLDPEVRDHDPHLALDGGADGLDAYRTLAPEIARILKPGGLYAVEIGWDQGQAVRALFAAAGLEAKVVKDLADRDRVVTNGPDPRAA